MMRKKFTLHQFADELSAIIREFLDEKDYYQHPVMTIGHDWEGAIVVEIHEQNKTKHIKDGKDYDMADLYVTDELRQEMPKFEAINRIAQEWTAKS